MLERIGWWTFDAETQTLVNRVSDQRIRFEGAVDDVGSLLHPPASGPARLRFSYQDTDFRYPVVVIARYETYGGSGFDHGDSDRLSLGWSIDHPASAAEWRRSCAAPTEIPSYGQWRRVDDALFDALSCWPSDEGSGPEPSRIDSWGGWFNGEWSPRLRRVGAGRADRNTPAESGLRPFVEPLGSPPLSWQFVDAQKAVSCAALAESEARSTRTATTLRARSSSTRMRTYSFDDATSDLGQLQPLGRASKSTRLRAKRFGTPRAPPRCWALLLPSSTHVNEPRLWMRNELGG